MSADARVEELGLELPPAPPPGGVYKPIVIFGNAAYVSGHGPVQSDGSMCTGRVGSEVDQQAGYDSARQTGLAILSTLRENLGSLDRVKRVIKTLGMVNAAPDFQNHPASPSGCLSARTRAGSFFEPSSPRSQRTSRVSSRAI